MSDEHRNLYTIELEFLHELEAVGTSWKIEKYSLPKNAQLAPHKNRRARNSRGKYENLVKVYSMDIKLFSRINSRSMM